MWIGATQEVIPDTNDFKSTEIMFQYLQYSLVLKEGKFFTINRLVLSANGNYMTLYNALTKIKKTNVIIRH